MVPSPNVQAARMEAFPRESTHHNHRSRQLRKISGKPQDKTRRTDPNRKERTYKKSPMKVRTVDEDGWITATKRVPIGKPRRKAVKQGPKKPSEINSPSSNPAIDRDCRRRQQPEVFSTALSAVLCDHWNGQTSSSSTAHKKST
ncbi:hypothetical protein CAEBREN_12479 [Caenorhabditis brenneri]|uniref:Uncharacterized protein n=1 Tax=Caenorhabditis brenneri TaxID=135651 RepID=G0NKI1_CAEBE|nr:hypothetical protein CAEBREN_12479 [Caenorhabditis brenneri]